MNYTQSIHYLNSFLNLERIVLHPRNRHWNLGRMKVLLDWFDHPERAFFPVLVAGTKGKGSTGFLIESMLNASGVRTGFYSSPHLVDPRERIRLDGRMVSVPDWTAGIRALRMRLQKRRLPESFGAFTYFEIMTLLALWLFREHGMKVGILEVGLGGRLDATNAVEAPLVVLTPISLDHEAFLGHSVGRIAREKAAVIHGHTEVVYAPQVPEAFREIHRQAARTGSRLWRATNHLKTPLGLRGDFQKTNAAAALRAVRILRDRFGFPVTEAGIRKGMAGRGWSGRYEMIRKNPDLLIDGAHNPASVRALVGSLKRDYPDRDRLLIFATSREKRSDRMLRQLSAYFPKVILTTIPNPRTQEIGHLIRQARPFFREIYPCGHPDEAWDLARRLASRRTLVVATGSFYLIGALRALLRESGSGQRRMTAIA